MKKILLALTIAALFCLTALAVSAKEYYIYTPQDMYNVRNDLSGTYYLMNDIDLSGYENWEPIGKNGTTPFTGTFDGQCYQVSGIKANGMTMQGLFGDVKNGTIKNVGLTDSDISGEFYVGGIVAYIEDGKVSNCYTTSSVTIFGTGGGEYTGGIAGRIDNTTIEYCYNAGSIIGDGGVVGSNYNGTITNCYNTGTVRGACCGGILGNGVGDRSTISNCYNTGAIRGDATAGGLVGVNYSGDIYNCYNMGVVTGDIRVGAFVGSSNVITVKNCYFDFTVVGIYDNYATGYTTEIMKTPAALIGFDFENVWAIDPRINNGYPYLRSNYIAPPPEENPVKAYVNGTQIFFDVNPIIIDGRTLVPLRAIFESLGATVAWDGTTQTITGTKDGTTIIMVVGQTTFTVNGITKTLDVPPQIIDSRTLVPARAIAESFGVNVAWNDEERAVYIG